MDPGLQYRRFSDSDQEQKPASGSRFFVFVSGNTGDAHRDLVQKLEGQGHTEVTTDEDCDYVLLFCPVASRVGTDVGEALRKAPAGRATVLVVMHHTFDPDHVVADSRRLVTNDPNVHLTVDCLFYENHFLDCRLNDDAWCRIRHHMRPPPGGDVRRPARLSLPELTPRRFWIVCVVLVLLLIMIIIVLVKVSDGSI